VLTAGYRWIEVEQKTQITRFRLWELRRRVGRPVDATERRRLAKFLKTTPDALGL